MQTYFYYTFYKQYIQPTARLIRRMASLIGLNHNCKANSDTCSLSASKQAKNFQYAYEESNALARIEKKSISFKCKKMDGASPPIKGMTTYFIVRIL
jgi:hypothetical protein